MPKGRGIFPVTWRLPGPPTDRRHNDGPKVEPAARLALSIAEFTSELFYEGLLTSKPGRRQLAIYTPVVYDAVVIRSVRLSRRAEKDLERTPGHIVLKLQGWIDAVEYEGLEKVRRIPGYHDEPLQGIWRGHRSIRLSRAYRAIYRITADESLELVYVERVTKHEY